MLTTLTAIFWFGFALLGWIIVAVLMAKPKDKDDPPPGAPGAALWPSGPPRRPAPVAATVRVDPPESDARIPHALEPPWAEAGQPTPLAA